MYWTLLYTAALYRTDVPLYRVQELDSRNRKERIGSGSPSVYSVQCTGPAVHKPVQSQLLDRTPPRPSALTALDRGVGSREHEVVLLLLLLLLVLCSDQTAVVYDSPTEQLGETDEQLGAWEQLEAV